MAGAGLAGLIALTNIGVYPRSMIGTDVERISSMNPPTACIVALTLWLIGLAMLFGDPVRRWLAGIRPWMAVIAANGVIMTVFLWHLTAYLLAILLLWPPGLGHDGDTVTSWWLQRPIFFLVPTTIWPASWRSSSARAAPTGPSPTRDELLMGPGRVSIDDSVDSPRGHRGLGDGGPHDRCAAGVRAVPHDLLGRRPILGG